MKSILMKMNFLILYLSILVFPQSIVFELDCTQSWQNSGMQVSTGDHLILVARGVYGDGQGASTTLNSWSSPDGRGTFPPPTPGVFVSDNSPIGALIGKIGTNGTIFGIGSFSEINSVNQSGNLYLSVNDAVGGGFSDNNGYLVVQIMNATNITDVKSQLDEQVNDFNLTQNFPNPFNPTTTINYSIPQTSNVKIYIYDVSGQLVKTMVNQTQSPGNYSAIWDSKDKNGKMVSSGTYFYQIEVNGFVETKKMILLK